MDADSVAQVGEVASSFLMYARCGVPMEQALPLIVLACFFFRNMREGIVLTCWFFMSVSVSIWEKYPCP